MRFSSDTDTEIVAHLIDQALLAAARLSRGGAHGARPGARRLRHRRRQRRRAGRDRRREGRLAAGARHRRRRDLRRERHPRAPRAHARRHLPRRRRDGRAHAERRRRSRRSTARRSRARRSASTGRPRRPRRAATSTSCSRRSTSSRAPIEDTLRGRVDLIAARRRRRGDRRHRGARKAIRARLLRRLRHERARGDGRPLLDRAARAKIPSTVEIGSEVRYREPVFCRTISSSPSARAARPLDTLAAVKTAKAKGAHILAVANVLDSAIPRSSDGALYTHAGPEIGVASTKCFTTQLVARAPHARGLPRSPPRHARASRGAPHPRRACPSAPADARRAREADDHRGCIAQEAPARARHALPRPRARASRSRSRARSSSRRSRTSTPRATPRAR